MKTRLTLVFHTLIPLSSVMAVLLPVLMIPPALMVGYLAFSRGFRLSRLQGSVEPETICLGSTKDMFRREVASTTMVLIIGGSVVVSVF